MVRQNHIPIPAHTNPSSTFHIWSRCFSNCCFFSLGLEASEASLEPLTRGISVFCSTLGPLDISPGGFPSQTFWGLMSPVQIPGVGVPDVGHQTLLCVATPGLGFLVRPYLCLSYWSGCGLSTLCCEEPVHLVFRGKCSLCSCRRGMAIAGSSIVPPCGSHLLIFRKLHLNACKLASVSLSKSFLFQPHRQLETTC